MSTGLYSGASGLALGFGLYRATSGLWGGASGLIAGFGGASLYLDFLTMTAPTFDPRITFSRGSNATLTDSTGKITYAPNNLLTNSESFEAAYWTKTNSSISANVTAAPNGTSTADKLVENTAASVNHSMDGGANVVGIPIVYSVYAKAAGRSFLQLTGGGFGAQGNTAIFNLSNGTMFANFGNKGWIVDAGNGWYRCYIAFTPSTTGSIGLYMCDNTGNPSYTGDGTSGIFFWGAQLEQVTYQTTPSTYQATTSTAYYGPRFDYDPVTLAAKGLLIEESRQNFCLQSAFASGFTTEFANFTKDLVTSPAGTTTGGFLVPTTANSAHKGYPAVITGLTNGSTYTASVYMKAGGYGFACIRDGFSGRSVVFNLNDGTVVSSSTATGSVTPAGNGWYRCMAAIATTSTSFRIDIGVLPNSSTSPTASWTGDGTSGIYIWGAQLEAGSFATSYIPTVASTVTRSADVATMTGANFSSWYNQTAGTFTADYDTLELTSAVNRAVMVASDGTTSNRVYTYISFPSPLPTLLVTTGGSSQASISSTAISSNGTTKTASAYNVNDFAISTNGGTVTTDTAGSVPSVNRFEIGYFSGVGLTHLNGHIRSIAYYNTRLPNAQLQSLTA